MEDENIIVLFFRRSDQAIGELLCKYGKLMHSIAFSVLNSEEDAEECINDAALDVWKTIPPTHPEHLGAYSAAITRRRSVDRLRYITAQKRGSGGYELILNELEECVADAGSAPSENGEVIEAINAFLEKEKLLHRNIFVCRYYLSMSESEISRKFEVSENYIRVSLTRSRKKLRNHLTQRGISI